ncbi:MAG: hypothetical protein HY231_25595 [Acidobacteria bacterium]|nr:hypothetical protein [Acidobacteriota bacterium]
MMKRFMQYFLIALFYFGSTIFSTYAEDKEKPDLLAKIKEARARLQAESVELLKDVVAVRRIKVGRHRYKEISVMGVVARQMALALMDEQGNIQIVRAIKKEHRKELEVVTPGVMLSLRRENGINSDIACLQPANGKVLAVRYPVQNENNRFGSGAAVIQAIYTPFSPEIKTEEMVKEGLKIQADFIDKAYDRLKSREVMSAAFPPQKVSTVIPKDILKILLLNEHIDPSFFKSPMMARPLSEQVLTIIATNRERAYAYSVSSAGARGLVQMIPSTYRMLMNKYPLAGLNPDFSSGMVDPVNAIVAQILLCDSDWQSIASRKSIAKENIGPFLAAAYNGGVGRVFSVLADDEIGWMEEPDAGKAPTKTVAYTVPVRVRVKQKNSRRSRVKTIYVTKRFTQSIFRNETSNYIKQYHWIANAFATIKAAHNQ